MATPIMRAKGHFHLSARLTVESFATIVCTHFAEVFFFTVLIAVPTPTKRTRFVLGVYPPAVALPYVLRTVHTQLVRRIDTSGSTFRFAIRAVTIPLRAIVALSMRILATPMVSLGITVPRMLIRRGFVVTVLPGAGFAVPLVVKTRHVKVMRCLTCLAIPRVFANRFIGNRVYPVSVVAVGTIPIRCTTRVV